VSTIRDVAKLAGVAPITASRVISNSGYASEEVRRRVRQAAAQLGYVPNTLARSLRSKQTHTLALVLTDITNPFWTTVARGVEDAASEAGFHVFFCNTDESEKKQEQYLKTLTQKQVDGVLFVPARSEGDPLVFLRQQRVPVVVLDRRLAGVDVVRSDSEQGAYQLVQLLLSLGHRHIAMLSGPQGVSSAEDRVAGYRRALIDFGVQPAQSWLVRGEFTLESGYRMANLLLHPNSAHRNAANPETPHRPSALFAANNFIAMGALRALYEAGLRVPEEMSVAAFDDLPPSLVVEPFLTVAAQSAYELGQRAAQRLVERIAAPEAQPTETVLPVTIIQRKSTRVYTETCA
jgi:LacI family transcriptional regulator